MCVDYLLQTEYVGVIAVDELGDTIKIAVVAFVHPAVDVVRGDPEVLAHTPHQLQLQGQLQHQLVPGLIAVL